MKTVMSDMKNTLGVLNGRFKNAQKKTPKPEIEHLIQKLKRQEKKTQEVQYICT